MAEIIEDVVYDCDFMKNRLPDHCADLIIADPPYYRYKSDFDFAWPTFDDYLNDVRRWGEECRRLLKDNGTLIGWGSDKRIAYSQVILDEPFTFLNSGVWLKKNGVGSFASKDIRRKFFPVLRPISVLRIAAGDSRGGSSENIGHIQIRTGDVPGAVHEAAGRLPDFGNGTGRIHTESYQRSPAHLHGRALVHARLTMGAPDPRELRTSSLPLQRRPARRRVSEQGLRGTEASVQSSRTVGRRAIPARFWSIEALRKVVPYFFSTSNHNPHAQLLHLQFVVSYTFSTSNHNVVPDNR